jgi:DNA-binding CsgD family transcriptional regulator/two-component sensor histidine kinase
MVSAMAALFHLGLGFDPTDVPLLILCALPLTAFSVTARWLYERWEATRRNEKRLADDVVNLITVNMDLQTFAMTVENRTLDEERKRISREIHDTVGYTLTTLKVLFEAAKGLVHRDPDQLEPLINQGLEYTRNSLEEIREAMRDLRRVEVPDRKGLHLVAKLVDNFRSVTHMAITLEFSGTRHDYGSDIDEFLYKAVQENLTNAYRHGKASKVSIYLQESGEELALMVRDNGQSARNFVKGIGMVGMEERAAALGEPSRSRGTNTGSAAPPASRFRQRRQSDGHENTHPDRRRPGALRASAQDGPGDPGHRIRGHRHRLQRPGSPRPGRRAHPRRAPARPFDAGHGRGPDGAGAEAAGRPGQSHGTDDLRRSRSHPGSAGHGSRRLRAEGLRAPGAFSAIRAVYDGSTSLSPGVVRRLIPEGEGAAPRGNAGVFGLGPDHGLGPDRVRILEVLNRREQEILALVAEGLSNKEIGARLFIAEQTIKNNICNIYEKLGVHDRSKLVKIAESFVAPETST